MKKLFPFILFILFFFTGTETKAQENSGWEKQFFLNEAREKFTKGEYELTVSILSELELFYPANPEISLEKSLALFKLQRFNEAMNNLQPILQKGKGKPGHYQVYGNSLDAMGKAFEADSVFKRGLIRFPDAGELYMELGITAFAKGDIANACGWWERGMEMAPEFASNYYWAAITYAQTEYKIRALVYGEIFLNLERNSERTETISDSLFTWYANPIPRLQDGLSPFEMEFEKAWNFESPGKENLSIAMLHRARLITLINWIKRNPEWHHPFWDRMEALQTAGLFESYDHWLFANGNAHESLEWSKQYPELYAGFEVWFIQHPLQLKPGKKSIHALFYRP